VRQDERHAAAATRCGRLAAATSLWPPQRGTSLRLSQNGRLHRRFRRFTGRGARGLDCTYVRADREYARAWHDYV